MTEAIKESLDLLFLELCFREKPVIVVGGGPSLRDFDWKRLDGLNTVGCNFSCPNPMVSISHDATFVRPAPRGCLEEWMALPGHHIHVNRQLQQPVQAVTFLNHLKEYSNDYRIGIMAGSNCGIAAINLADCLGARSIYLIGFDMKGENGQSANWHDRYKRKSNERIYDRYIKDFGDIAGKVRALVVNLTPGSRLECFPKGELSQLEVLRGQ
jgi:hypothetical protein